MEIEETSSNGNEKRIAKNTIMLYFRMLVTLFLSFFTTRELLSALGVESFGTVNLISSIVTMFSFLSNAIASASARFFSIELGRKRYEKLRRLFSITLYIYIMLVIILLILCETIGVWVLYNKLNISISVFESAKYFFHFTVVIFLFNVLTVPYSAIIISRENMGFIAIESISVSVAKLAIVYLLYVKIENRIVLYGLLLAVVAFLRFLMYLFYCLKAYGETKPILYWNSRIAKKLIIFGGWNIFGVLVGVLNGTVLNIILNNFFGTAINAARSIAVQASGGTSSFAQNFILATNPQIIKYWGIGCIEKSQNLVIFASKYAYFLMFVLALPILTKTNDFLSFWLADVPSYAVIFTRLMIIQVLIDVISFPLMSLFQATGKIALYQMIVSFTILLNLPISYLLFKYGYPPQATLWMSIVISLICIVERMYLIRRNAKLPIRVYARKVLMPIIIVSIICAIISIKLSALYIDSVISLVLLTIASMLSSLLVIFMFGITQQERDFVIRFVCEKLKKVISK